MAVGTVISQWLSPDIAGMVGGCILILIGIYALIQVFRTDSSPSKVKEPVILNFEIKMLGVVVRILRQPMSADLGTS